MGSIEVGQYSGDFEFDNGCLAIWFFCDLSKNCNHRIRTATCMVLHHDSQSSSLTSDLQGSQTLDEIVEHVLNIQFSALPLAVTSRKLRQLHLQSSTSLRMEGHEQQPDAL